jgi:hypothetical protein
MFFIVSMSPDAIIAALTRAGVDAEWLQRLDGNEEWSKPLLKVAVRTRSRLWFNSLNPEAIACLMLELVDLPTWSQHVRSTLSGDIAPGTQPWPYFRDEYKTWT